MPKIYPNDICHDWCYSDPLVAKVNPSSPSGSNMLFVQINSKKDLAAIHTALINQRKSSISKIVAHQSVLISTDNQMTQRCEVDSCTEEFDTTTEASYNAAVHPDESHAYN